VTNKLIKLKSVYQCRNIKTHINVMLTSWKPAGKCGSLNYRMGYHSNRNYK